MSQQHIALLTLTAVAAGNIAAARAVGFDSQQIATQGAKPLGIAQTASSIGQAFPVITHGTAIAETGAAINAGAALIADSQGRVIPSTGNLAVAAGATAVTSSAANGAILTGGDSPEFVIGDALASATGAGQFIEILLRR
ncbi:hypothetical protein SIID45300_01750 [Candidatus Magnetaquicoccaceae bacterium FCR-1]|uniref:DUF2190 domain-containing protein n=1 Tax=Candidatus Magnetaquiglobus chichijimensis TaxID=3141448 RepID=A0ABQ0C959_9PROT